MNCEKHTPVAERAANSMDQARRVAKAYPDSNFFISTTLLSKLIVAADTLADVKQWLKTGQVERISLNEEELNTLISSVLEDLK